jgi:hypothetical protein
MGALGKMSRGEFGALDASDRMRLDAKGVTESDFKVWSLAQPEIWRGSDMLTMQSIRSIPGEALASAGLTAMDRNRAVSKMLGMIVDESEYASLNPNLYSRTVSGLGTSKGTVVGEITRSAMLFKGFPIAMISRHWGRMADMWKSGDKASSVGYGAALISGLTVFGALAMQLKDLANGKDPRDMTTAKFWSAAFMQGGGMGIFGDILYTGMGGNNRHGTPNWVSLFGPVFGDMAEFGNITLGNVGEALRGKETHTGAELLQYTKSHLPFVNLWYAKSAIDHAVLQDVQEILSPGYLSRMKNRAQQDWGQKYWWSPGDMEPGRGPNLEAALGSN